MTFNTDKLLLVHSILFFSIDSWSYGLCLNTNGRNFHLIKRQPVIRNFRIDCFKSETFTSVRQGFLAVCLFNFSLPKLLLLRQRAVSPESSNRRCKTLPPCMIFMRFPFLILFTISDLKNVSSTFKGTPESLVPGLCFQTAGLPWSSGT